MADLDRDWNETEDVDGYAMIPDALITSPEFQAVWSVIKHWDISRNRPDDGKYRMYAGATGTDVIAILSALSSASKVIS